MYYWIPTKYNHQQFSLSLEPGICRLFRDCKYQLFHILKREESIRDGANLLSRKPKFRPEKQLFPIIQIKCEGTNFAYSSHKFHENSKKYRHKSFLYTEGETPL